MNVTTRNGLGLLPLALAVGLLGDWLLRSDPWGLNIFLWMLAGGAALAVLSVRLPLAVCGQGVWLAIPALLLAAGLAWRDSATLKTLDLLGLLFCLAVGAARTKVGVLRVAGILDLGIDCACTLFQTAFGPFMLFFQDIRWKEVPRTGWLPRVLAVLRGIILVLPLLLLFGGLLTAADAVYSHLISQALHFDAGALCSHVFLAGFLAWLVAGYGRGLLIATTPTLPADKRETLPSLGMVETATILGLLNVLFLSFVLVQIRYFFGGAGTVHATVGLTYAQYARTGFFELVWVAALVLPLLLGLHWLQRPGDARAHRLFSWQAAVQIGLLFVIMASAWMRMRLYQSEYGLTELRLYTTAFMGWLTTVFIWFALTVLRGRREHFAFGAVATAFGLIFVLHLINPDDAIVHANLAHAAKGHAFDADYAASLSADAVPALVAALPALPPPAQGILAMRLLPGWSADHSGWRSWSWGRARAFGAVRSHQALLQSKLLAPPPPPVTKTEDE